MSCGGHGRNFRDTQPEVWQGAERAGAKAWAAKLAPKRRKAIARKAAAALHISANTYKLWALGNPVNDGVSVSIHVGLGSIAKKANAAEPNIVINETGCWRARCSLKGLSPTIAAGLSDTLWSMTDMAEMIDASLPKLGKRGPYKQQC